MDKILTLGSLFDGIGGFPLCAEKNKIKTLWASEIEPFPIAVSKQHFPATNFYGDIKSLKGEYFTKKTFLKDISKNQLLNWYNKLKCDNSRYKALGNSIAIPCVDFIIKRIKDIAFKKVGIENEK